MLELENIDLTFHMGTPDEMKLFDHFNFSMQKGDFASIVGSNGSGKTTLLNMICGSIVPDRGKIIFQGDDITTKKEFQRAAFIGRVFQSPQKGSCGNLTILENMALSDNKKGKYNLSSAISKNRIDYYRSLLQQCGMGLENRLNTPTGALSGGQRQALALIIAKMTDIELLILDEHTAALDPKSSEIVMALTDSIVKENNVSTLMVTHNLKHALQYGNRLVMMHEGNCILDIKDDVKKQAKVEHLLSKFNEISIEYGN